MALLELIGRLGLNTQPFEAGMRRARQTAHTEGHNIGHAFQQIGLGLLGIHGLSRAVTHIVQETIEWSKDIDKAREEFERLGIAIDEGALKSIRAAGMELERIKTTIGIGVAPLLGWMTENFAKVGSGAARLANYIISPFDPNRNKKLDEDLAKRAESVYGTIDTEGQKKFEEEEEKKFGPLREQLQKLKEKNILEQMTNEEKLAYKLDSYMLFLEGTARPGWMGKLKDELVEHGMLGEIIALQKSKTEKAAHLPAVSYGSLAHIGGFGMLAQPLPAQRIEQLVTYTQATAKHTELTAEEMHQFRLEMQFINNRE